MNIVMASSSETFVAASYKYDKSCDYLVQVIDWRKDPKSRGKQKDYIASATVLDKDLSPLAVCNLHSRRSRPKHGYKQRLFFKDNDLYLVKMVPNLQSEEPFCINAVLCNNQPKGK